jgi:hypothetical protein
MEHVEKNPQRRRALVCLQTLLGEVRYGTITLTIPVHDWRLGKLRHSVEIIEDLTSLAPSGKK